MSRILMALPAMGELVSFSSVWIEHDISLVYSDSSHCHECGREEGVLKGTSV